MIDEDTDAPLAMLTEPTLMVTTLLDHRRVSKYDLSQLYARRWNVELDLRNLDTTTGMDILS